MVSLSMTLSSDVGSGEWKYKAISCLSSTWKTFLYYYYFKNDFKKTTDLLPLPHWSTRVQEFGWMIGKEPQKTVE